LPCLTLILSKFEHHSRRPKFYLFISVVTKCKQNNFKTA